MGDPVAETIAAYERSAGYYIRRWRNRKRALQKERERFVYHLFGRYLLDAGCGPGPDARIFSELGLEVLGIDLCDPFLTAAKDNAPRARFLKMDMRRLAFAENSFDGVWACASLLHLPKAQALPTLQEFRRVLKPGGLLFLSVMKGEGEKFHRRRFFAAYSAKELEIKVRAAGFGVFLTYTSPTSFCDFVSLFARANQPA